MEISTIQIDCDVFLTFKGREYRQVKINDIVWIHSKDHYIEIKTVDTAHVICASMKNVSKYLTNFIKVDETLIVNRYYISKIVKNPKNADKYCLVLSIEAPEGNLTQEISSYLAKKVIEQL